MVDLGAYCIDSTEVTNAHYQDFLDAGVELQAVTGPAYCSWNTSYIPTTWPPPPTTKDQPVAFVDWCDAYAYCQWAGKRLCGAIGGGPADFGSAGDDTQEWYSACANGTGTAYTYGDVYDPIRCNGQDLGVGNVVPVASLTDCHGTLAPFTAVHDMTGNVREWEDACTGQNGANDTCRRRGGSFMSPQAVMVCDDSSYNATRDAAAAQTGIRCCSP
jgi:formylglycine-generating enzyme required for sulfatase activity